MDVLSEKHKIKRNNNISSNDTQDIIQQLPQWQVWISNPFHPDVPFVGMSNINKKKEMLVNCQLYFIFQKYQII